MPIILGTRSRAFIRYGPAQVYIAEGGTAAAAANFGGTIDYSDLETLLVSFSWLGTLEKNPVIKSEPLAQEFIDTDNDTISWQAHHRDEIAVEMKVAELDNTIANALISRYENKDKTDFLWLRKLEAGDYVNIIHNVPFLLALEKNHTWDDIEKMIIRVSAKGAVIKNLHSQLLIEIIV